MKTNNLTSIRTSAYILMAAVASASLTGCYTPDGRPDNTATGALAGGAFGAATGALIGGANHNAGGGAAIGAAAGLILGGLIGHSADQEQERRLREQAPATYTKAVQATPLSVADVKAMAKAGVAEDTIIAQIANSRTIYHLSANDIIDLSNAGVGQKVTTYMINTPNTVAATPTAAVVAEAPPPPIVETVVVSPGPDYVWTSGEWVWHGGWYWSAGYWSRPPYPHAVWVGGYWGHGPRGYVHYGGHWRR